LRPKIELLPVKSDDLRADFVEAIHSAPVRARGRIGRIGGCDAGGAKTKDALGGSGCCWGDRFSRPQPLRTGYRFRNSSTLFLIKACSAFRAEYSRDKRCCRLRSSLSEAINMQS